MGNLDTTIDTSYNRPFVIQTKLQDHYILVKGKTVKRPIMLTDS